jgi:hypothetical protein
MNHVVIDLPASRLDTGGMKRGYPRNWASLRQQQLQLFPFCWECEAAGKEVAATHADHVPPLSHFPDPRMWHGYLRSHCKQHSDSQGGKARWARVVPQPTRDWG